MELTITTPALLFPAISLLLLAYTNRFLAIAALIRNLHAQYKEDQSHVLLEQISNLRKRVILIRNMQAFGVLSLFFSVLCMFLFFTGYIISGKYIFGVSLLLLIISLIISIWEIQISVKALNLHLSDMEHE